MFHLTKNNLILPFFCGVLQKNAFFPITSQAFHHFLEGNGEFRDFCWKHKYEQDDLTFQVDLTDKSRDEN